MSQECMNSNQIKYCFYIFLYVWFVFRTFIDISNNFPAFFSCFTLFLFVCWSLTTLRCAISRTTFHFVRSLAQIELKSLEANSLSSNDTLLVSDNLSNSQKNIAIKSKRIRAYLDKHDNRRIVSWIEDIWLLRDLTLSRTLKERSHLSRSTFFQSTWLCWWNA